MGIEQKALGFAARLKELYLERRDMAALLDCMDPWVTWIGTGVGEVSHGIDQARLALEKETQEYSGPFHVEDFRTQAIPLSEDVCVVYGDLRATPLLSAVEEQNIRFSAVCILREGGLRLLHIHFSRPDSVQEEGHYFVRGIQRADNATLRSELENLIRNIPGGAHQCRNDPKFTLVNMSDGFLTMFGYSQEEVRTRFDSSFINMIYPGDQPEVLRSTHRQLQTGLTVDLEYRVLCADGHLMWVLDKGRLLNAGTKDECFYCVLIDITKRKQEQEQLRLSLERHKVIMDQATDIIFEWDIQADTLLFSPNWRKKFGYQAISQAISSNIPLSSNIHPDDMPAFVKIMRDTAAGIPYSEAEFRIKDAAGQYHWCRIRATTQYDEEHHPIKAVGVILDINMEKKLTAALLERAQRDALTGLYNKAAMNTLVPRSMGQGGNGLHALMMIDVDHFKTVNDTYGHLAGDHLLSAVATALQGRVRGTDLVGRIGGDEFLVFLPQVKDAASALGVANDLLSSLHALVPGPNAPAITCSIGLACCVPDEAEFLTLCQWADLALYHQKENGRKGVSLYRPGAFPAQREEWAAPTSDFRIP